VGAATVTVETWRRGRLSPSVMYTRRESRHRRRWHISSVHSSFYRCFSSYNM